MAVMSTSSPALNVGAAVGLRDEVDAFGGAAHKNDFVRMRRR